MPDAASPQLLDGRALAESLRREFEPEVRSLIEAGRVPRLVIVQVGEDAPADAQLRARRHAAADWRIDCELRMLPADASVGAVRKALRALNRDRGVSGVLLSQPLPESLPARTLQHEIRPSKDVEGVHPENLGGLLWARYGLLPCTALATLALIDSSGIDLEGKQVAVVGHSELVGKPVALLALARNATVTVSHRYTRDLAAHTRHADVLVVALGQAGCITADMVKGGAVVIDAGISAVFHDDDPAHLRIVGDVAFEEVAPKTRAITPVPGGVGPVTTAMLMRNTVLAARGMPPRDDPAQLPLFS